MFYVIVIFMAYSLDFRKRVIEYRGEGNSLRKTSEVFAVAVPTIREWERKLREENTLDRKPLNRTFRKLDPEKLRKHVEEHPDAYLRERADYFGVAVSTVADALARLGITYKKNEHVQGTGSKESRRI